MSGKASRGKGGWDICEVCGHEVFEDDGFCVYCGEPYPRKKESGKQAKKAGAGGGAVLLVIVLIVLIWFIAKK